MKRNTNIFRGRSALLVALPMILACVALFASCENTLPEISDATDSSTVATPSEGDGNTVTIQFEAVADPVTRTAFGAKDGSSYPTLWPVPLTGGDVPYFRLRS